MEYRLGNGKKIDAHGETASLTCPHCGKKVTMSLFSNGETTLIPEFPLFKSGKVFFAVCPECSAVFGVEERAGKAFVKGEPLALGNYDLKELTQFGS